MSKKYIRLAISEDTYKLFEACRNQFKSTDLGSEMKDLNITEDYMARRIFNYYLEQ